MNIFVVSLLESKRRKAFTQEANKYNLNFEYIDAINGKLLDVNYIHGINNSLWVTNKYKRKLGPGEIGCSLSHKKIYEKMQDKNEFSIILEDDVIFDERLFDLSEISLSKLDKNALYILGGQQGSDSKDMIIKSLKRGIKLSESLSFYKLISSDKYIFGTCCYLIHSDVARKLYSFSKDNFFVADDWLNLKENNLISDIYYIDMIKHPEVSHDSLIEIDRVDNKSSIKNSILKRTIRNIYKLSRIIVSKLV